MNATLNIGIVEDSDPPFEDVLVEMLNPVFKQQIRVAKPGGEEHCWSYHITTPGGRISGGQSCSVQYLYTN